MRIRPSLVVLPLIIALSIPAKSAWTSYRELHILGRSVIRLLGGHGGGTGFQVLINGKQYTMTNDHVCGLADKEGYMMGDSQYVAIQGLKVLVHAPDTDLCLLTGMEGLPALDLGTADLEKGEALTIIGHPRLRPIEARHGRAEGMSSMDIFLGIISSKEDADKCSLPKNHIVDLLFGLIYGCLIQVEGQQTTARIEPGNSGSPVVDSRGKVRGVAFASDKTEKAAIIPFHALKAFLAYCQRELSIKVR